MTIKTISSSISSRHYIADINQEVWLRDDISADIGEGEDIMAGYKRLRAFLKLAQSQALDELSIGKMETETIGTDEDIYSLMDKCTTVEELVQYKLVANVKVTTGLFYDKKLQQLSNK